MSTDLPHGLRHVRIGLIGGESTGKSTVAAGLHALLGGSLVTEVVRDFTIRTGRPPRRHEQAWLMAEQAERARLAATPLICDPASLQVAIYSLLYFDDDSLITAGISEAGSFDAILWCRPDIPWIRDPGVRDGQGHRDAADRIIAERIAPALEAAGPVLIEVTGTLRKPALLLSTLAASLTPMGDSRT